MTTLFALLKESLVVVPLFFEFVTSTLAFFEFVVPFRNFFFKLVAFLFAMVESFLKTVVSFFPVLDFMFEVFDSFSVLVAVRMLFFKVVMFLFEVMVTFLQLFEPVMKATVLRNHRFVVLFVQVFFFFHLT